MGIRNLYRLPVRVANPVLRISMGGVSAIPELITGPPPPDTNMKAANKEAAEECLSKAQAAFGKRSFKEALRLAEKSSRMCRTEEADGENIKL